MLGRVHELVRVHIVVASLFMVAHRAFDGCFYLCPQSTFHLLVVRWRKNLLVVRVEPVQKKAIGGLDHRSQRSV